MTGFQSKKAMAQDKLDDDDTQVYGDALTIAYQSGYHEGKKAAQPAQEPVAEIVSDALGCLTTRWSDEWVPNEGDKLYTHPPQRPWVGLTSKDLNEIFEFAMTGEGAVHRAIAKFKEKNT
jgi:hypothetical protein